MLVTLAYVYAVDGFIRLRTGVSGTTILRDIVLYVVVLAGLARFAVSIVVFPRIPLAGMTVAWIGVVIVQVTNPAASSVARAVAATRPHLEFVPLFFLGFALLRSLSRLRAVALVLVMTGALNGAVGLAQVNLSPQQLASWGAGYKTLVTSGTARASGVPTRNARTFVDAGGTARVRPPALGGDAGFGGVAGAIAIPLALALALGAARGRQRTVALAALPLLLGAVLSSQTRAAVVAAAAAVVAFLALSVVGREGLKVLGRTALAGGVAVVGFSLAFGGTVNLSRLETIAPTKLFGTFSSERGSALGFLPDYLANYPFGSGLGTSGPATSLGASVNSGRLSGENLFVFLTTEVGVAGLALMCWLLLRALRAGVRFAKTEEDAETRLLLSAFTAGLAACIVLTFSGAVTATPPGSPFIWITLGVISWWCMASRRAPPAHGSTP